MAETVNPAVRNPEVAALRAKFASLGDPRDPDCLGDISVYYVSLQGDGKPCSVCASKQRCDATISRDSSSGVLKSPPALCFGDVSRFGAEGCNECQRNLTCGDVVDERLFRLYPEAGPRYPGIARGKQSIAASSAEESGPTIVEPAAPITPVPATGEGVPVPAGSGLPASAPVAAEEAPMAATLAGYRFPGDDPVVLAKIEKLNAAPTAQLIEILEKLSNGICIHDGQRKPYDTIRPFVCAISLILNSRHHCPPRFRPLRTLKKAPKGTSRSAEESTLSNDRQVIDLHWLWSTKQGKPKKRWQDILSSNNFDFRRASEFVATVGKFQNKVEELRLRAWEMFQLAAIQTESVRNACRHVLARAEDVERDLDEWVADRTARIKDTVADLKAQFTAVSFAQGDHHGAAHLYTLMTQKAITPKTMQRRREKFIERGLLRPTAT